MHRNTSTRTYNPRTNVLKKKEEEEREAGRAMIKGNEEELNHDISIKPKFKNKGKGNKEKTNRREEKRKKGPCIEAKIEQKE